MGTAMNKIAKFKILIGCAIAALLTSCTQAPMTGRDQLILVPDSLIHNMASQSYEQFLSQNKLSNNVRQTNMVKHVGQKIQHAVEKYGRQNNMAQTISRYKWEFNLIADKSENAWAMPGGKVVVYTGLLDVTKNEAGLAVVMAHEIAHIIARHGGERMTQGLLVEVGGMALSQALSKRPQKTQNLFMRSYNITTQYGVLLPYSRIQETEADHLGLIFMAMAGYNPNEAVSFWQRMAAKQKTQPSPPELLSSHPADETRIKNIQQLLPKAMTYYHGR